MTHCPKCGASSWLMKEILTRSCSCQYCNTVFPIRVMDRIEEDQLLRQRYRHGYISDGRFYDTLRERFKQREEDDLYFELKNGRPWYAEEENNEH